MQKFTTDEFKDVKGSFITELSNIVVNFTIATYLDYNQHCLQGNVWSYDSTFLFVGSVATTIGYGNVTPKTHEKCFPPIRTSLAHDF